MPPTFEAGQLAAHLKIASELIRILAKGKGNPSAVVSDILGRKKRLSGEDRRILSSVAFTTIRNRLLLTHCAEAADRGRHAPGMDTFLAAVAATGVLFGEAPRDRLSQAIADCAGTTAENAERWSRSVESAFRELDERSELIARAAGDLQAEDRDLLEARCSMRAWILERWEAGFGSRERAYRLALSLCADAPVCLRVNTRHATVEGLLAELAGLGVSAIRSEISPTGIVLTERAKVTDFDAHARGCFEIQDIASQLVAHALAPSPGMRILDACAGAGGKSLHLADLVNDEATIIAFDTEALRLKALRARTRRCGVTSIRPLLVPDREAPAVTDARVRKFSTRDFDAVLVDAPCSALGTARRNPMVKWRLTPGLLRRLAARQQSILSTYAQAVADGGTLVYSTCSLMREENEEIVDCFLDSAKDFHPDPLPAIFKGHGVSVPIGRSYGAAVCLTPDADGTDGFFIARMRRG